MNIYLLIFLLLLLFSFLEISNVPTRILRVLHIVSAFLFILVAGFRYETGVDWLAYENYFSDIVPLNEAFNFNSFGNVFLTLDVGYSLLNSIVKMFGGGVQVVFLIISVASTFLLIKNLKYYSNHVLTGLLIYYPFFFFIFDMSGIRQGLAIQIVLFSIKYISKKDLYKFSFYILLATSIHWTALILLPLYFFVNKKISLSYTVFIFIISIVIFTFKIKWMALILGDLIGQLNTFTMLSDKVEAYTTNDVFSQERGWDMFSLYNFSRISLIITILYFFRNKISNNFPSFNTFYNFILLELFCIFCLFEFFEISERLRFYFTIAEVVIVSHVIFIIRNYIVRIFALLFLAIGVFLNAYPFLLQLPSTIAYHPYQNYVLYSIFDLNSSGYYRLQEHKISHE